jgi:hypothetical protein
VFYDRFTAGTQSRSNGYNVYADTRFYVVNVSFSRDIVAVIPRDFYISAVKHSKS